MRLPLLTFLLLAALQARSQFTDSFSDSNYTAAPPWSGTAGAWTVNAQKQLQSTFTTANSSCYLSTSSTLATAQWDLWLRLAFSTSSANYVDVWLMSSTADPDAQGNTGYFVRVGSAQDDICLYRRGPSGAVTRIIDGPDGSVGGSDNRLHLQVARSATGLFILRHASEGGGYVTDGQATDATYNACNYFALSLRQSTASFFGRHYFDDISVTPFVPDTTAPALQWIGAPSDSTVELRFSEGIDPASLTTANYTLQGTGAPIAITIDPGDASHVLLKFAPPLPPDTPLLLTVRHIRDAWGNELVQDTDRFYYHRPRRHDLLITEIMADPEPAQGLPAAEYVELFNRSRYPIALRGWRLATASTQSAPLPDTWLQPDSFVVLSSAAQAPALAAFGKTIGLGSFPALDNDGALLQLRAADGSTIHAVAYERSWYGNAVKDDGGWSLELIDVRNPCAGADNWSASADPQGGTPGRKNCIAGSNPDKVAPRLLRSYAADSLTIVVEYSEPLDSISGAAARYTIEAGPAVRTAQTLPPLFQSVELRLAEPLQRGRVYQLRAEGPKDCSGAEMGTQESIPIALPEPPAPGSIVVNELLYSPQTGGSEYVEVLARGRTLELSQVFMATRNSTGTVSTPRRLSERPLQAFPGEYHVFAPDAADVGRRYVTSRPEWLHRLTGMPALPDEGTTLLLLDRQGNVLEEVPYSPKWQFALIDDAHGVALERLDPSGPGAEKSNWHSAAATAGFGTPTARNSQYRGGSEEGTLTVSPAVFSPDNDGFDDVAVIAYEMDESGYVANLSIFDALGRPVRRLVKNGLLGRSGQFSWDGLDEQGRPLLVGTYVLFAELLNLNGKRQVFKRAITIAKLNH